MEIFNSTMPLNLKCDKCQAIGIWYNIDFYKYFSGIDNKCPICGKTLELFKVYTNTVYEHFMFFDAFHCIGATSTTFSFILEEGKPTNLEYSKYGIPKNAKILNVNYTPEGPNFPMEAHGNNPLVEINRNGPITIFPVKIGEGPIVNKVNAMVTWIQRDDSIFDNLIKAFLAFSQGDYNQTIIPANVVVEFSLNNLINDIFGKYASNKRVEEFLKSDATYSHQLNILLPYIVAMEAYPIKMLSDNIRGKLNALREKRNELAHRGQSSTELTKEAASELITSSLFGYIYLNIVKNQIGKNRT